VEEEDLLEYDLLWDCDKAHWFAYMKSGEYLVNVKA
jgi:hypothetical protein